jgi:amino acid adenylation domain-containing protein
MDFNVSLPAIFQHPTIESLRKYLREVERGAESLNPISPFELISEDDRRSIVSDVEDAYPLTMLQAGMIFHSEYLVNSPTYHDIVTFHIRAPFNEWALRLVLDKLAERHSVLRTSFDLGHYSRPLQLVHTRVSIPMNFDDLSGLSASEQDQVIESWVKEEKKAPFDWNRPPLLRVQIHQRGSETFQFSMAFHHSILDGWSVATMLTELFQKYLSVLRGEQIASVPLKVSFRDYVAQELRVIEASNAQSYWSELLSDLRPSLLSGNYSGEDELYDGIQVETLTVPIAQSTCERLRKLARSAGVSLKTVLLAAHVRTMRFYLGRLDVVTGLVSNSRPETDDGENVLGLFLTTIPFRLNAMGGTWLDLIQDVLRVEIDLMPYRNYPLGLLQRANDNRPLFDTVFNYVHFHVYNELQKTHGVEVLGDASFEQTNFPLAVTFNCHLLSPGIELALGYDTSRIDREYIKEVSGTYLRVLDLMAEDPSSHYDRQNLLSSSLSDRILREWNATETNYPRETTAHELFEEQMEKSPNAIALEHGGLRVTYGELNARANRLARHLRAMGVEPEMRVAISLERSIELVAAQLAVLKCGAAYVPIDPAFPDERQVFMAADCEAKAIVTTRDARLAEGLVAPRVDVDDPRLSKGPSGNLKLALRSEMIAYVMYTSGSTGRPKGVEIRHRGITRLVINCGYADFNAEDRVAFAANPAFDAATMEVWAPLLNGGRIVVVDREAFLDPRHFAQLLERHGVTALFLTTAIFNQYALAIPEALARLRYLFCGGEKSDPSSFARVLEQSGPQHLVHCYGPTEATTFAITHEVTEVPAGTKSILIGRPISNTQIYILDANLQPTPIGVAGELFIGGAGVARGYLNRPDLTAERFLKDPFTEQAGALMYKTGDLGCWLEDGTIEFLGRNDYQVKIRGFRIELGEIEARLAERAGVGEVVVVMREDSGGDKQLVAYYTGEEVGAKSLRAHLSSVLPEHMVPSWYVWLERMPVTANGKLNREALPEPVQSRPEVDKPFIAPQTEVEERIAAIWRSALQLEIVGTQDNFFDLGGHSLHMLQIQTRLQADLDRQISIAELFQFPTIRSLAKHFNQSKDELQPQLQNNLRGEKRRALTQARRAFRLQTKQT